jgi:asparagine synthase (glutamine-hydrolysing)
MAAERYGAQHYDMTISAADFAAFMPRYIWHMEEPVCEPPAVALYYVSALARNHVKVLLSGEGGDEAFAGYPNYRNLLWLERLKSSIAPLSGAGALGLSIASSLFRVPRVAKYAPLMKAHFPDYYYSRTSSPHRNSESGLPALYRSDFASTVDPEYSVEQVIALLTKCYISTPRLGYLTIC